MSEVSIDSARFRQVLGSYPTGVCVITAAGTDGQPVGMVVGTFTSVSLDPPLVGFLPDKKSSSWPLIEQAGKFCVNILGSDQQDMCRKVSGKGPDKFAQVAWTGSLHGLPILAETLATIECSLHSVIEAGDHWFVIGNVLAMQSPQEAGAFLVHHKERALFTDLVSFMIS